MQPSSQFPKRYHLLLDFLKNPFTLVHKGVPSRIYAPGDARSLGPCGASMEGESMGAKVSCIPNKLRLLRNQVTFARKRDTRKRAPSELCTERFL
jgi:hypothetical protein